jgi:large subunit ribosomal protein L28
MAKHCQLSKKKYNRANKVSFSNKHHRYQQQPNLQTKRFFDAESGQWVKLRVSAKAIKTIAKFGLRATIKRYQASPDLVVQ